MKTIRILLVMIAMAVVAGCGSDKGQGVAQNASTITMNPASTSTDSAVINPVTTVTQPITMTVLNSAGNPLRGARVDIFLDFATLLDANLVPQTAFPYQALTDDFGNIRVYVAYAIGGGLSYKASLQAFSGSAYQTAPITVTCSDSGATTCP